MSAALLCAVAKNCVVRVCSGGVCSLPKIWSIWCEDTPPIVLKTLDGRFVVLSHLCGVVKAESLLTSRRCSLLSATEFWTKLKNISFVIVVVIGNIGSLIVGNCAIESSGLRLPLWTSWRLTSFAVISNLLKVFLVKGRRLDGDQCIIWNNCALGLIRCATGIVISVGSVWFLGHQKLLPATLTVVNLTSAERYNLG